MVHEHDSCSMNSKSEMIKYEAVVELNARIVGTEEEELDGVSLSAHIVEEHLSGGGGDDQLVYVFHHTHVCYPQPEQC